MIGGRTLRWAWAVAGRATWRHGRAGACRLTVLRHHRVYADGAEPLYRLGVSERLLGSQLDWLAGHARVTTVSAGVERLRGGEPGHWVALAFDDGYADNVTRALPLLQRAGVRATFYLTAGHIETRGSLWWDDLADALEGTGRPELVWDGIRLGCASVREKRAALAHLLGQLRATPADRDARLAEIRSRLAARSGGAGCQLMDWEGARALARAGMELGAHTLTHPHLSLLDPAEQRREVEESRRLIEQRVGARVTSFAYPSGDYSEATVEAVGSSGLLSAVTTRSGENLPSTDLLRLRRRALGDGACLNPAGRFSPAMTEAELRGAFDRWRAAPSGAS